MLGFLYYFSFVYSYEVFTVPGLIHVVHMEWHLAETPAIFSFHRVHVFHMEWTWNGQFHMESNLIPYGLRLIHYGFHGLVPHGLHGLVPHGLTQNRTEYLLIILVSECRVIDKMMYFVQRAGSCHVTCSHVNQYEEHQSHHHHHHDQSIPRCPLTAHHLYNSYCKSRHETTHPGQLQDTTTTPSHTDS